LGSWEIEEFRRRNESGLMSFERRGGIKKGKTNYKKIKNDKNIPASNLERPRSKYIP
jgi:hypothetical protein